MARIGRPGLHPGWLTPVKPTGVNVFHTGEQILLGLAGIAIAVTAALILAGWAARIRTSTALRTE